LKVRWTDKADEIEDEEITLKDGREVPFRSGHEFEASDEEEARGLQKQGFLEIVEEKISATDLIEGTEEEEPEEAEEEEEPREPEITPEQNKKLHAQYREVWGEDDEVARREFLKTHFGVEHTNELTRGQAADAIERLSAITESRELVSKTGKEVETGGMIQILKREPSLVELAAPMERVKKMMDMIQETLKKLLDKRPTSRGGDIMYIAKDGSATENPDRAVNSYIVRSGLRKIAYALDLDMDIVDREKLECEDKKGKYYMWRYTARVRSPYGRTVEHDGVCTSRDKFFTAKGKTPDEANIMKKAETSAYNRAIMDLTGVKIGPEEGF